MQDIGGLAVACDSEYFDGGFVSNGYGHQLQATFAAPAAVPMPAALNLNLVAANTGAYIGAYPSPTGSPQSGGGVVYEGGMVTANMGKEQMWQMPNGAQMAVLDSNGSIAPVGVTGSLDGLMTQANCFGGYVGGQYVSGNGQCGGQTLLLGVGNGMGCGYESSGGVPNQLFQQQADDASNGQQVFFDGSGGEYSMQPHSGDMSMNGGGMVLHQEQNTSNGGYGAQQKHAGASGSTSGKNGRGKGGRGYSKGEHTEMSSTGAVAGRMGLRNGGPGSFSTQADGGHAIGRGGSNGKGNGASDGTPIANLFVSNMRKDTSLSQVRDVFKKFGHVVSCRVFVANSRTCALVKMNSVAEAEAAVWACDGSPWNVKFADKDNSQGKFADRDQGVSVLPLQAARKPTKVNSANASSNLYVKGLPLWVADFQLQQTFSRVGKVVEMKIMRYQDTQECAALVRMESVEAAKAAVDHLDGQPVVGYSTPLTVRHRGKEPTAQLDNLYIKGLPADFSQEELQALFAHYGTVKRCRLLPPVHNQGGNGKTGFSQTDAAGLVQMATLEEAAAAIEALNGIVPEGIGAPRMIVRFAETKENGRSDTRAPDTVPSDNLYVKGLPLETPEILLRAVFAQFGSVSRLKVLPPRPGDAQTNDCAALVQMSSVSEAEAAVAALHGRALANNQPGMRIRFAGKDQQPGTNLYVAGLPTNIQEEHLRATFAAHGAVQRLRLLVQPGRPETHALVQMATEEEAKTAMEMLSGKAPLNFGMTLVVRFAARRHGDDSEVDRNERSERARMNS